ncbi:MAG: polyprenyl synthetase family protein, partial [Candidatus Omnitrophica bacterium]|nr:polyprenyl synthetase family protein [Candidatus Omnitrophota bacterium]
MPTLTNPKALDAIYQPIQGDLLRVEETLRAELRGVDGFLGEMTRYVSETLGKRLRPALALFSARAVSSLSDTGNGVIQMAAAVELIHTATLVHDDVIDHATLRRAKPTVNARWGNTLSVLAGDYLYSQAFCLLSAVGSPEVLRLMSRTSQRVCVGEVTQVRHQFDVDLSEAAYLKIIREKTASLMAAACQAGALLVGAPASVAQALAA